MTYGESDGTITLETGDCMNMRFATRLNSFLSNGDDIKHVISQLSKVEGLTDVELNYPEHFSLYSATELKSFIAESKLNFSGVAVRFRNSFIHGEFKNRQNAKKAVSLAHKAIEVVKEMGGNTVTIWLEFDGNDYSFQTDYSDNWNRIIQGFKDICDFDRNIKISIEFKPFEPRGYSSIPNTGTTLHALSCIARPNIGMTLDYCHSLMAMENPSFSLVLASMENKLFGVHLNDGTGYMDNGMIFGSNTVLKALEFIYYLKRFKYNGLIYFDTFPIREDPYWETGMNIMMFKRYWEKIEAIGMDKITEGILENKNHFGQSFVLNHLI